VTSLPEEKTCHPVRTRAHFARRSRRTCGCFCRSSFCRCISCCHPRRGSAFASRYPNAEALGTVFVEADTLRPNLPSGLCEVPSARSDSEIRLVHLDLNPVVLVWPCVTWNVEGDLILEELTLVIAPSVGPITSSVGAIRHLYLLRAYCDGPKRCDGLRQVVVENLEVLLLKIGDTLSGRRRNYNVQANASGNWTAFGRGLLSKSCRKTKHHRRQNDRSTLVDKHTLTSLDSIR
jgi:hypothetical protein